MYHYKRRIPKDIYWYISFNNQNTHQGIYLDISFQVQRQVNYMMDTQFNISYWQNHYKVIGDLYTDLNITSQLKIYQMDMKYKHP